MSQRCTLPGQQHTLLLYQRCLSIFFSCTRSKQRRGICMLDISLSQHLSYQTLCNKTLIGLCSTGNWNNRYMINENISLLFIVVLLQTKMRTMNNWVVASDYKQLSASSVWAMDAHGCSLRQTLGLWWKRAESFRLHVNILGLEKASVALILIPAGNCCRNMFTFHRLRVKHWFIKCV